MWLDGTALYYTARLEDFWRLPVPYVFDHLWSIKFATWATLMVEFALGVLIWFRDIRYLVLLAGLMLHLGIEWSMNVPLFSAMMLSAYVAFLEPAQFRRSLTWLKARLPQMPSPTSERAHATVFYDGRCRLCRLTRDLLQCLDVFRVLRFVDFRSPDLADGWPGFDHARAEREMLLCSPENEWCSGYHAFRWMSLRVPLLWPLAAMSLLPGASQVGTRIYGWVSVRRRLLLGRACADEACILPKRA
jgi:predicted DCC family thiol-disulfide oxidoreductase YuxK